MKRFLPILQWLPGYNFKKFRSDLPAGLTVGIMLIPQGMAYAMIAGLPPVFGLYAALMPQVVYAILGTSRQLAVGPVAMDSLLVASGLGALSLTGIDEYIAMAVFLALFIGGIQLLLGICRMGFLVNFLSKPVISGFTSAAAIIIGLSQLKHLLGADITRSNQVQDLIVNTYQVIDQINPYTISLGLAGILLIVVLKKWLKKIPAALVVVVGGIIFMYASGLHNYGVQIVENVPGGLPKVAIPQVTPDQALDLLPIALTLALIAFMEAISVAKAIEEKHGDYEIDPNQELIALGSANIIGSLFQSYPTTGGFSRTAVNHQAGAKTGMAAIISAIVVGLTLLFLTPLFYYLPKALLASIIMVAVFGLIDFKYPVKLWKSRKDEFLLLIFTFGITLSVGITEGILLGVIFSLLLLVFRTAKPHVAEIARIRNTNYFRNIKRFEKDVELHEGVIILRFDAQLYFGNTAFFKSEVLTRIKDRENVKAFILNAESISYIDSTAALGLIQLIKEMQEKHILFIIAGAIGPTRDIIFKSDIIKVLGKENLYTNTARAVDFVESGITDELIREKIAHQSKDH
jgi:SulP family sulfate permease